MSAHEIATAAVQAMRDTRANRSSARIAGAVLEALHRAGYAVVELPQAQADWHGGMSLWPVEQTWHGQPDSPGEVTIRKSDGRIGVTSVSLPTDSPATARSLAAALLAAADAAEHPGTPVEASPQETTK